MSQGRSDAVIASAEQLKDQDDGCRKKKIPKTRNSCLGKYFF
jgi:hypothetical protein